MGLDQQARSWPTPNTAPDAKQLGSNQVNSPPSLGEAAKLWATPRTITGGGESAERKKELGREDSGGGDLQAQVEKWPTPQSHDVTTRGNTMGDHHYRPHDLSNAVEAWPTPASRDYRTPNSKESEDRRFSTTMKGKGQQLQNFVEHSPSSPLVRVISVSGDELSPTDRSTVLRRRLNPAFVCWLMGWPWWWTNPARNNSVRAVTGSYLFKLRLLSSYLLARYERFLALESKVSKQSS